MRIEFEPPLLTFVMFRVEYTNQMTLQLPRHLAVTHTTWCSTKLHYPRLTLAGAELANCGTTGTSTAPRHEHHVFKIND